MQAMFPSTTTSSKPPGIEAVYAENERRAREAAIRRMAERAERIEAKLARMLPERYRDAELEDASCKAWFEGYRAGERRNLLMTGETGTVKTTQAYALLKALMRAGVNCTFDTSGGHLRHVKRAYDGDFTEEEAMEQLASVPVLFIDDLGKESPTQWAVEHLFDLVDARVAHMRPIVVTTNLNSAELRARYGEAGGALVSRLAGGASVAHFTGPDRRLA